MFQGVPAMYARLIEWQTQTGARPAPNRLRLAYIGGSRIDAPRKARPSRRSACGCTMAMA